MKKILVGTAIALVAVIVLGVAGFAYAQSQQPTNPNAPFGFGQGMMGGRGMMGGWQQGANPNGTQGYGPGMMGGRGMMGANGSYGPMHTYMVEAMAKQLNLTVEDLQTRIQNGETPYEIAKAQGLTDEQIQEVMSKVHDEALAAAVAAGVLTQEQADWMDQHMEQMWQNGGFGAGPCHGGTGAGRGPAGRWNNQPSQPTS